MSNTKNKPDLHAYVVSGTTEKPFYNKIGAAWYHKEGGGLTLKTVANSLDGEIVLFPPKEKTDDAE